MEDVLAKIMKDASSTKHKVIKQSCLESQELLANQQGLMRSPSFEIRCKVLETLKLALETKQNRLVSHALAGLQRLVWDRSFQSAFESDNEEEWLPMQMISAFDSFPTQSDDTQVQMLKVVLTLSVSHSPSLTPRSVMLLLTVCLSAAGAPAPHTAARAALTQMLQAFLQDAQEINEDSDNDGEESSFNVVESVAEEVCPVLCFICQRLKEGNSRSKWETPLLLQGILTILQNIKVNLYESTQFINLVWQELCPVLVSLLGSPCTDRCVVTSSHKSGEDMGRGSACFDAPPASHATALCNISVELVRLTGCVGTLRPVLESLFHRMLLYPPPHHRMEPLKALQQLFCESCLLLQFCAPPLHATSDKDWMSLDLDLLKIGVDALGDCCRSSNASVCYASVNCASTLLRTLQTLAESDVGMTPQLVKVINDQFTTLESADYKGAKSERWLKSQMRSLFISQEQRRLKVVSASFSDSDSDVKTSDSDPWPRITDSDLVPNSEPIGHLSSETKLNENRDQYHDVSMSRDLNSEPAVQPPENESNDYQDHDDRSYVAENSESDGHGDNDVKPMSHGTIECEVDDHQNQDFKSTSSTFQSDNEIMRGTQCQEDCIMIENSPIDISCDKVDVVLQEEKPANSDQKCGTESQSSQSANHTVCRLIKEDDIAEGKNCGSIISDELERSSGSSVKNEFEQQENGGIVMEHGFNLEGDSEKDSAIKSDSFLNDDDAVDVKRTKDEHILTVKKDYEKEAVTLEAVSCRNLEEGNNVLPCDVISPVTESAEEALNYISSSTSEDFTEEEFEKESEAWLPGREERTRREELCAEEEFARRERENAQHFVDSLRVALPGLLRLRSCVEADQALQEFASEFCEGVWPVGGVEPVLIINADGVYLATYSALLLNLKLLRSEYYSCGCDPHRLNITQVQFVSEVQDSGVLVYLSSTWLAEVYQQVLVTDLLEDAGYRTQTQDNNALINLLAGLLPGTDAYVLCVSDVDGLGESTQLSDFRRLQRASLSSARHEPYLEAGRKLCRRVLTCCWDTLLEVLSTLLDGSNSCGISAGIVVVLLGGREEPRDAIAASLDALQIAAKLANELGLQSLCAGVLRHLAAAACPLTEESLFPVMKGRLLRKRALRLHASQLLAMDVLLGKGLELGSHSPDCWKHIFQCCLFVLQLENTYFSGNRQNSTRCGAPAQDVSRLVASCDVLRDQQLRDVIEVLSLQVDQLFENAAGRLNLSSLVWFVSELCAASAAQLTSSSPGTNLLLFHLGEVLLRCARAGRPLLHLMRAFSAAAPHLVQASCHRDLVVSRRAVATLTDVVGALLSSELPHFHFHELLFQPFERLLALQQAHPDVREQMVSSLCALVEGCPSEIRSGWRPLFGALRTPPSTPVVRDLLDAFLLHDDPLIFAHSAGDCVVCLTRHLADNGQSSEQHDELCLSALQYLERCSDILASMYQMPNCPAFSAANRIQLYPDPTLVEPLPEQDIVLFEDPNSCCEYQERKEPEPETPAVRVTLRDLERPSGIVRVWWVLVEGLVRPHTPLAQEALFRLLKRLLICPGVEFGLYCVNHLLLPMLQGWLRVEGELQWIHFRHCAGLTTDLVIHYLAYLHENFPPEKIDDSGALLMVHQLLLVLTECIAQPVEVLSRLGCACIRHLVLEGGHLLTSSMWERVCGGVARGARLGLRPLYQLLACFQPHSDSYEGDSAQVKVSARPEDAAQAQRLAHIAQQVFLLECQQEGVLLKENEEPRSFTFLLCASEEEVIRVPLHSIVVGLLSHQILLQIVVLLLLQGTQHRLPALKPILPDSADGIRAPFSFHLLNVARDSRDFALAFDARPGLKFLLQKAAALPAAANLHRQMALSWSLQASALLERYTSDECVSQLRALFLSTCDSLCAPQCCDADPAPLVFLALTPDHLSGDDLFPNVHKEERVYRVVAEQSLMSEFKKRKSRHSLPPVRPTRTTSLPHEIEQQKNTSILKDSAAGCEVLRQLVASVLEAHVSLADERAFKALLPAFFPGARALVAQGEASAALALWMDRLAQFLRIQ